MRIEPGSILQLLYPCSRYSPDRCLVCGGTFRDHLTLWWANNLYTPFDNYMDRVYAKGVKLEPTFPLATTQTRKPSRPLRPKRSSYSRKKYNSPKRKTPAPVEMTKLFAFHRQYVVDVETIMDGTTDKEQRKKKLHKELKKARMKADSPLEIRMFTERRFFYVIPAVENTGSKKNKSEQQKPPSPALMLARAMVLNALDDMIGIQENENDRIRTKKQHDSCCN